MRFKIPRFTFIGFVLSLLVLSTGVSAELRTFEGKSDGLNNHTGKGKWTIVMLWASDCHVCNQEADEYVQFHKKHKDTDAQILGVSLDGKARYKEAKTFLSKHKINFPSLIGEPEEVATLFQELTGEDWRGTPTFLVYSPKGELLAQQVGAVPTDLIEQFMAANK
ncbi:MAG: TlpA family protein disulfide reductase [Gammaproteobacteria bacterium]|nr:TlpA family protein disulfide reductase [Gammaproteobacteria bacterium]MDH5692366.1 TlpA family protein disulfide reductase [Gammaproteobacteria bacterium]